MVNNEHIPQTEAPKQQLPAANGAAEMFGIQANTVLHETGPLPSGMPIVEASFAEVGAHPSEANEDEALNPEREANKAFQHYMKMILPYAAVFILGIFLYFFYFTDFSVSEFFKKNDVSPDLRPKVASAMAAAQKDKLADYQRWMGQFYFEITDEKIIDPNEVNCACGLTNFEKYLLNLNPKIYDTLGAGSGDGQNVINNVDPSTGEPFQGNRKLIVEQYFDTQLISDRISVDTLARFNQAQANSEVVETPAAQPASPTQPAPQSTRVPQISATSTINLNSTKAASVSIPKINVTVPIIFSQSTKDFEKDLVKGAVHYPGTVLPGEMGNSYISAHSSALPWVKSPYKNIFARFGELKEGDSFVITATSNGGKEFKLNYVIRHTGIYEANDQSQFINTAKSEVSLSTCWPIGTAKQRYVVRGELTQVEQ